MIYCIIYIDHHFWTSLIKLISEQQEHYFLLCDALPEDRILREQLQQRRLVSVWFFYRLKYSCCKMHFRWVSGQKSHNDYVPGSSEKAINTSLRKKPKPPFLPHRPPDCFCRDIMSQHNHLAHISSQAKICDCGC